MSQTWELPDQTISPLWSNRQGQLVYWSRGAVMWTGEKWVDPESGLAAEHDPEGSPAMAKKGEWLPWLRPEFET